MSVDLTVLIPYDGINQQTLETIGILESKARAPALVSLDELHGLHKPASAYWFHRNSGERLISRPLLPNLEFSLWQPEYLILIFGRTAISVYTSQRLQIFMEFPLIQRVMLDAIKYLCDLFHSPECFITSDHSHEWWEFHNGKEYNHILAEAFGENQSSVVPIEDIYFPYPPPAVNLKPESVREAELNVGEIIFWSREQPQPDGWIDPLFWKKRRDYHFRLAFEVDHVLP